MRAYASQMRLFKRWSRSPESKEPAPNRPTLKVEISEIPRLTAKELAQQLLSESPNGVDADTLWDRSEAAGVDIQVVDREIDLLSEAASIKVVAIKPSTLRVIDLSHLDASRLRIVGSAYWVTEAERNQFGGATYLLVREPSNEHDPNAVAVYGRGRKVGHLSRAKAKALAPLLDQLEADAFEVTGKGTSRNSMRIWVDLPRVEPLRRFARDQRP